MESIFKWISQLSMKQGLGLLGLVALIMLSIPYGRIIFAFVRQIVYRKPLIIETFQYHFFSKDSGKEIVNITELHPDYLIDGSVLMLSWQVSGAWRVDVEPIGRDLRGNAASFIFTGDCLQFSLKAYGFFRPPEVCVLQIPLSSAYVLDKKQISTSKIASEPLPGILSLAFTRSSPSTMSLNSNTRILQPGLTNMRAEKPYTGTPKQRSFYRFLDKKKILQSYSFSTKKYPNTLH